MNKTNWFKQHKILTAILVIILALIFLGAIFGSNNKTSQDKEDLSNKIQPKTEESNIPSTEDNKEIPVKNMHEQPVLPEQKIELYKVIRVVDGDTIDIETGARIRLICINTPEVSESGYAEASDYLEDLILDKKVRLERDVSETDRYGRLLRYIYTEEGNFVNEMIVKNGYASAYKYNPESSRINASKNK